MPGPSIHSAALKRNGNNWLPILAGGAALGLSYPPFGLSPLAWVALAPLVGVWDGTASWRRGLIGAYTFFLATFAVAFSWPLLHVLPKVALASLTGVLVLPLWLALPFALAWPVRKAFGRAAGLAALCGWYLCAEAALSVGPLALPWPLLGHTQAEALAFNQFADFTGVPGLTLWVLLLNVAFYLVAAESSRHSRIGAAVAATVLLAAPLCYGIARVGSLNQAEQTISMGLIQPGMGPHEWADQADGRRVGVLLSLTDPLARSAVDRPALVIWPETALAAASRGDEVLEAVQEWVDGRGVAVLSGAVTESPSGTGETFRNSALLFQPREPVQQYDKQRLVPFAEQSPWAAGPLAEWIKVSAGGVSGYEAGGTSIVLRAGNVSVGVMICLESVFGSLARSYAGQGAELLVAVTQDGWWGRSAGYRQHLAFTRLRAIETRRAVAQVSVSGRTALVLPDGRISEPLEWMQRSAVAVRAPLRSEQTFFTRYGPLLNGVALGVALLSSLAAAGAGLRQREMVCV